MATNAVVEIGIDALKASAEWRALSAQMRVWLETYLTNGGDPIAAARAAYPSATAKSQTVMSYQVAKNPAIMAALDWFRWRDARNARSELIALVRKQIEACEPGSVAAQRFASQLERLTVGAPAEADSQPQEPEVEETPEPDTPRFYVGQRVEQKDDSGVVHIGVVRSLRPDGRPDTIEEIQ